MVPYGYPAICSGAGPSAPAPLDQLRTTDDSSRTRCDRHRTGTALTTGLRLDPCGGSRSAALTVSPTGRSSVTTPTRSTPTIRHPTTKSAHSGGGRHVRTHCRGPPAPSERTTRRTGPPCHDASPTASPRKTTRLGRPGVRESIPPSHWALDPRTRAQPAGSSDTGAAWSAHGWSGRAPAPWADGRSGNPASDEEGSQCDA
jgi:hypothetical protein